MSATAVARTLVKTTTPGWFIDAADPDGNRVRKTDADTILTRDQYEASKSNGQPAAAEPKQIADRTPKAGPDTPVTMSGTGKMLVGPTVTIKCKWVPEDQQTAKVKALYDKDQRQVTVEQVEKAAGHDACGEPRTIKVQDHFQAKFCDAHQDENRKAIRRRKAKAKRAAKK